MVSTNQVPLCFAGHDAHDIRGGVPAPGLTGSPSLLVVLATCEARLPGCIMAFSQAAAAIYEVEDWTKSQFLAESWSRHHSVRATISIVWDPRWRFIARARLIVEPCPSPKHAILEAILAHFLRGVVGHVHRIIGLVARQLPARFLVQHADHDTAFQTNVLTMLTSLVGRKETSPTNYAYLYDRVAVNSNRPQRYGTQGRCTGSGIWEARPTEDPGHLDERRAAVGLEPQAEYRARFTCRAAPLRR